MALRLFTKMLSLSRVCMVCATTLVHAAVFGDDIEDAPLTITGIHESKGLTFSDGTRWYLRRIHPLVPLDNLVGKTISFGPSIENRYGEHIGNVFLDDGTWLQHELVRTGQALVSPSASNVEDFEADFQELLRVEREAESMQVGYWSSTNLIQTAASLEDDPFTLRGTYQIVEGEITDIVSRTWNRQPVVFINFGQDYREDFTVTVQRPVLKPFRRHLRRVKRKQASLKGQMVRIRGLLTLRNGPSIELEHPLALQIRGLDY